MKDFNKNVKKLDVFDIKLIELTSASFILFLITVWPALMILVHKIHWGWFLGATVIFAYKPLKKLFF
ncbi:MAG: hypothetical protein QT05_C0027G0014 [archaeon GW2011_AR13]|nr:MAG: hypothetical protein QT05_C0027G0014 [archaeon GW2011_AR13]HIG94712.1 hypothetical protein [Nanoarchaeota archaeon]HIH63508.1 hypothetical protein [Nanoarchaeota archaeon]HIJ09438.1 hypothetical protein [Nanoarchaeota archaeon]